MKILSHRGLWRLPEERNSYSALVRSLEVGYGFESDIRDYCEELVISHNQADAQCVKAEDVFRLLYQYNDKYCFAINIKADGLIDSLSHMLNKYHITNYFCFDMSVPQMIEYAAAGLNFFTRLSEYEQEPPVLMDKASGIWIDAFENSSWITDTLLKSYLNMGKQVCLVSPELHQRSYIEFWKMIKDSNIDTTQLILCTDIPEEANLFFGGEL